MRACERVGRARTNAVRSSVRCLLRTAEDLQSHVDDAWELGRRSCPVADVPTNLPLVPQCLASRWFPRESPMVGVARPPPIASGQRACFGKANRRHVRGAQPRQPPQPCWKRTRPAKQTFRARILVCASPNFSARRARPTHRARPRRRDSVCASCRSPLNVALFPRLVAFLQPRPSSLFPAKGKCGWQIVSGVLVSSVCATTGRECGDIDIVDPGKTGWEPSDSAETTRKRGTASRPTQTPRRVLER